MLVIFLGNFNLVFRKFPVTIDLLLACDAGFLFSQTLAPLSKPQIILFYRIALKPFFISGTVLNYFRSSLTEHRHFVALGEYRCDIGSVFTGIPQGSILGTLLFSLYLFLEYLSQLLNTLYSKLKSFLFSVGFVGLSIKQLRSLGDGAFSISALKMWNQLPVEIREAQFLVIIWFLVLIYFNLPVLFCLICLHFVNYFYFLML